MIDKVGAIILQSRRLLIARNKDKEMFFLPGGQREGEETDVETLRREVFEELGVTARAPIFYREFMTPNHDFSQELRIRAYFINIEGTPEASSEVGELAWVDRYNYEEYKLGNALKVIIPKLIKDDVL